jgi:acyl carrier protein
MNDIEDFLTLLRDELGMAVTRDDLDKHLDQVAEWDSAHLVELVTLLERDTGHGISLPDALTASSLAEIYEVAVAGAA